MTTLKLLSHEPRDCSTSMTNDPVYSADHGFAVEVQPSVFAHRCFKMMGIRPFPPCGGRLIAHRQTIRLTLMIAFVAAVALGLPSRASAGAQRPVSITPTGLSNAVLGSSTTHVVSAITKEFGSPSTRLSPTPVLYRCGIDHLASWHSLSFYFRRGRLVGVSAGPGRLPLVETSNGLRLGDTLKRGASLYGPALQTSTRQGGVWKISTSSGSIRGYLTPSKSTPPTSLSRISTFDVGVVGCPSMTP